MTVGSRSSVTEDAEFWEVSHLAARLNQYACEVGARHLQDDYLRLRFTQEIAGVGQAVVEQLATGYLSAAQALQALEEEYAALFTQVGEYAKLVAGVIAGGMQIRTGIAICQLSPGPGCVVGGIPLMLHGANNIYENALNIVQRRKDTVGPLRSTYQSIAKVAGGAESQGNIIYGVADLTLSGYSLGRLVLKPGAWRLFRYVEADKVMAYKVMSTRAIMFEVGIDMLTGEQVLVEAERK